MTFYEEISELQARIAKAHLERDTWRASGMQEKYLESHSMVDALELQLEALRQQGLQTSARKDERERTMAEFSIAYDGRQYQYGRYRYDRLDDAVSYARLQRATPAGDDAAVPMPAVARVEAPGEADRELMQQWSITFQDGVYSLGAYRYDRLADALSYARLLRLQPGRPMTVPPA